MKTLSVARLRELLSYDPETGVFTRKTKIRRTLDVGSIAGVKNEEGYIILKVDGSAFKAHRLALAYVEGVFPSGQVDHVNGVKWDNRICNLRHADNGENQQNRKLLSKNTSGRTGVYLVAESGKWRAIISINKKRIDLGRFRTVEEASEAYLTAKKSVHTFNPVPR